MRKCQVVRDNISCFSCPLWLNTDYEGTDPVRIPPAATVRFHANRNLISSELEIARGDKPCVTPASQASCGKGERIGFASNWRREPSELRITYADGRAETRRLAPLEVIEIADE